MFLLLFLYQKTEYAYCLIRIALHDFCRVGFD